MTVSDPGRVAPYDSSPFSLDQHAVDPGLAAPVTAHRVGLRWPACECSGCFDEGGLTWTGSFAAVSATRSA